MEWTFQIHSFYHFALTDHFHIATTLEATEKNDREIDGEWCHMKKKTQFLDVSFMYIRYKSPMCIIRPLD